jgi:hypothetical protein
MIQQVFRRTGKTYLLLPLSVAHITQPVNDKPLAKKKVIEENKAAMKVDSKANYDETWKIATPKKEVKQKYCLQCN